MTTLRQSKEVQQLQSRFNEAIIEKGAPCDGYTEEFYADSEEKISQQTAKFICAGCPIKQECLDYAMAAQEEYGIWGGLTADERKWYFHELKKIKRRIGYNAK
jgi:hypothetical protein